MSVLSSNIFDITPLQKFFRKYKRSFRFPVFLVLMCNIKVWSPEQFVEYTVKKATVVVGHFYEKLRLKLIIPKVTKSYFLLASTFESMTERTKGCAAKKCDTFLGSAKFSKRKTKFQSVFLTNGMCLKGNINLGRSQLFRFS